MFKSAPRAAAAAAAIAIAASSPVLAQDSTNVIGTEGEWTVFSANSPKECWAVSPPKSSKNTDAEGNPKEVTRSDIRLYIAYRPGAAGDFQRVGFSPFNHPDMFDGPQR